jgi:hypothetical protein
MNSLEKLEKIQIVPNPSAGNFRIKGLKAGEEIWLRDARGILIFQGDPQNHDFSGLSAGLYNLREILFKKVCKAQKFTIFELTNLKSIYYELYTTASKRNFRSDSLRREWLSTNSQVFIGSHNAF